MDSVIFCKIKKLLFQSRASYKVPEDSGNERPQEEREVLRHFLLHGEMYSFHFEE